MALLLQFIKTKHPLSCLVVEILIDDAQEKIILPSHIFHLEKKLVPSTSERHD